MEQFELASKFETDDRERAIAAVKARTPAGESLTHCLECEDLIPEERREALPGCKYCIGCALELEEYGHR